jgi:hypothetical protein
MVRQRHRADRCRSQTKPEPVSCPPRLRGLPALLVDPPLRGLAGQALRVCMPGATVPAAAQTGETIRADCDQRAGLNFMSFWKDPMARPAG